MFITEVVVLSDVVLDCIIVRGVSGVLPTPFTNDLHDRGRMLEIHFCKSSKLI